MNSYFILSEKKLRKIAKKVCNGHQHALRYNVMLTSCFTMGQMVLDELEKIYYITDEEIDSMYPLNQGYEDENKAAKTIRNLMIDKISKNKCYE